MEFACGVAPLRMFRTVSAIPVANIERRRSGTPDRSMRSSRRCLKPNSESEAPIQSPCSHAGARPCRSNRVRDTARAIPGRLATGVLASLFMSENRNMEPYLP